MNVMDIVIFVIGFICVWAIWKITKWIIKMAFLLILTAILLWYFGLLPL